LHPALGNRVLHAEQLVKRVLIICGGILCPCLRGSRRRSCRLTNQLNARAKLARIVQYRARRHVQGLHKDVEWRSYVERLIVPALAPALAAALLLAGTAHAGPAPATWARCAACHDATKGGPNKIGPNLYGVVGKKAARMPLGSSIPMGSRNPA
jgi:cytochrome c553